MAARWIAARARRSQRHLPFHRAHGIQRHRAATAEDIAREVDRLGGMLDAFTAKEMVCFNTRVLGEHLPKAFDILADIVLDPKFAAEDIAREQSVILEEIRMTQDNPEDLVHELFTQNFWNSHALGKPIRERPKRFPRSRARRCKMVPGSYAPNCLVITAAGNLTHKHLVELVSERFSKLAPAKDGVPDPKAESAPHITLRSKRELEQVHICLGVPRCRSPIAVALRCRSSTTFSAGECPLVYFRIFASGRAWRIRFSAR